MSQSENTKPKGAKSPNQMLVRFGRLGQLGWFDHHESHVSKLHTYVVIKTERGLELGQIVGGHCCYRGAHFKNSPEQVEEYFYNRTKEYPLGDGGDFVRYATPDDLNEQEHLEKNSIEEARCCQRIASELGLEMKIIEAEHLFGGERIIFYFTSDHRVDFRELVKRLAREYQTRIELRQIGSRDEARMISDFETCGQQCCCSRFLKILEPVNMRMAKLQKATLDPAKISGHCGRLKCCLRYEDQTYTDLKKNLPSRNTPVRTPKGVGRVVDVQVLTQLVNVQLLSGDRHAWPLDEITIVDAKELEQPASQAPNTNANKPRTPSPVAEEQKRAITEELLEVAEDEQDSLVPDTDTPAPDSSDERDRPQQQNKAGQGGGGQGEGETKKRRRRNRSKNKNRSEGNAAGGDQKQQDSQNRPPRNRNRRKKNKPAGGESGNRTETSQ